jgi:hypothetical protein
MMNVMMLDLFHHTHEARGERRNLHDGVHAMKQRNKQ